MVSTPLHISNGPWVVKPEYVVGLDLGQISDYSALAVVETTGREKDRPRLVRHLARFPLGTKYNQVVAEVLDLLDTPPLAGACRLGVDQTGVGRGVTDMIRDEAKKRWRGRTPPRIVAVTITAGYEVTRVAGGVGVPKMILVNDLAILLENRKVKTAPELPEAATLVREMDEFVSRVSAAGRVSYGVDGEWRVGANDDLLLALAIACWTADNGRGATMVAI